MNEAEAVNAQRDANLADAGAADEGVMARRVGEMERGCGLTIRKNAPPRGPVRSLDATRQAAKAKAEGQGCGLAISPEGRAYLMPRGPVRSLDAMRRCEDAPTAPAIDPADSLMPFERDSRMAELERQRDAATRGMDDALERIAELEQERDALKKERDGLIQSRDGARIAQSITAESYSGLHVRYAKLERQRDAAALALEQRDIALTIATLRGDAWFAMVDDAQTERAAARAEAARHAGRLIVACEERDAATTALAAMTAERDALRSAAHSTLRGHSARVPREKGVGRV